MESEVSRWQYLRSQAQAGALYLDPQVAMTCRDACNRQIDLYTRLRDDLKSMSRVVGLGDFACADELAKMLGAKAAGGDRDFDTALREHTDVLVLIRDTIEASVDHQVRQEDASRTNIEGAGT